MMIQYEVKITGRVQGVGFRQFTTEKAKQHHIKGWVKNARDESVELVAQGEEKDMDTFLDYLRNGPSMARVDNLSKYKSKNLQSFDQFRIAT